MKELYDAVMVLHALAALAGFGSLAATGAYAGPARSTSPPPAVLRYFAPGPNRAAWALFAVPVLGVVLLVLDHFHPLRHPYPFVGIGIWLASAGIASIWLWPAERAIKAALAAPAGSDPRLIAAAARCCRRAALATSIGFVVALFFMAVQPG